MTRSALWTVLFALQLSACAAPTLDDSSPGGALGGKADTIGNEAVGSLFTPGNRYGWGDSDAYVDTIQPLFGQRCVTCHGCGDSPCQLKLTSFEGLNRGANEINVFGDHVFSTPPTRLVDRRVTDSDGIVDYARSEMAARDAGYYSVVNGGADSLMSRLLTVAQEEPLSTLGRNLAPAFSLYEEGLQNLSFQCTRGEEMTPTELTARAMPFGLPELSATEHTTVSEWIQRGAQGPSRQAQIQLSTPSNPAVITEWESFFNQNTDKGRLVARYLYEHMYFAHLYFPEARGEFYEVVRSRTPAPLPIDEIATTLPNGDPDGAVFYRFRKYTALIAQKSHVAWELTSTDRARWQELFLDSRWEERDDDVKLPSYGSRNPFSYFDQIPSMARSRFMMENGLPLVQAMITADVCTGTQATYAIRDRFWVWFLDPESDPSAHDPKLGNLTYLHINPDGFDLEGRYQRSFERELRTLHPEGLSLDDIWDGNGGSDPDAWITVLRHERSATAHHGAVGGRPETMWLLSYSNFERLYYNLVIDFETSGNIASKVQAWKYMSRVRTEGEDLWLSMLPEELRLPLRHEWTMDFGSAFFDAIGDITEGDIYSEGRRSQITVDATDPMGDLIRQGREYIGENISGYDRLNPNADPGVSTAHATLPERIDTFDQFEAALAALSGWRGPHAQHFPNVTVVRVRNDAERVGYYTIINNRGYVSHDLLTGESRGRNPNLDVLSAMEGIRGNYPELFLDIKLGDGATEFVHAVAAVQTDGDWVGLQTFYSDLVWGAHLIQRTDVEFWPFFDAMHTWHLAEQGPDAGILDVSQYIWPR